jgi:uncharacterized protein (UPF0335 family)
MTESLSNFLTPSLKSFAERLVRLMDQAADIASDIKNVEDEIKATGLDKKLVKDAIKIMRMDATKRDAKLAQIDLFDTYLVELGVKT